MIQFAASVAFEVPTSLNQFGKKVVDVDKKMLEEFWEEVGPVADKRGAYVFSLKAAKGEKPWYVGKAAKQAFRNECFTQDKRFKFDSLITARKGTPFLRFVFHKKSGRGKWATKAIDEVEKYLIEVAYARNSSLLNLQGLPSRVRKNSTATRFGASTVKQKAC